MSVVGVAEAAQELGVSDRRVRQMLANGHLRGERVGRSWVLDSRVVQQAAAGRRRRGRPWSEASSWQLLSVAAGVLQVEGSPSQLSRARARNLLGVERFADRLANRAVSCRFFAHSSVLVEMMAGPDVVASGVSALAVHDVGLVVADQAEGYVRASRFAELIDKYALDGSASRPNLLLRVVSDRNWPFADDQQHAPAVVVALDLLGAEDSRSRRAGRELLERT
ncbi:MAG: hypothetical protein F4003_06430 [Acidimicrobiaceae bacterium]|nr:hypothetical protein [Acidimicrobiaceae bacterium]MYC41130.1 hypothetical protein [Acidimicrobiaceae bacterium]